MSVNIFLKYKGIIHTAFRNILCYSLICVGIFTHAKYGLYFLKVLLTIMFCCMLVGQSINDLGKEIACCSHINALFEFGFFLRTRTALSTRSKLSSDFLIRSFSHSCLSAQCEVAEMQNYFQ